MRMGMRMTMGMKLFMQVISLMIMAGVFFVYSPHAFFLMSSSGGMVQKQKLCKI